MKPIIMDDVDAVRADHARAEAAKLPYRMAAEFSKVLREWLTPLEMSKVITGNRRLGLKQQSVCCTHDFCDANMAMDAAFKRVLGREFYLLDSKATEDEKDADTDLWNEAWGIAKAAEFNVDACMARATV